MSKHYSCELGELRRNKKTDVGTDKFRQRNISILTPAKHMEGAQISIHMQMEVHL